MSSSFKRTLFCLSALIAVAGCDLEGWDDPTDSTPKVCRKSGCSSHLCTETDMVSTCEWHESYACYQAATCARQEDGQCGFTVTAELTACLKAAGP